MPDAFKPIYFTDNIRAAQEDIPRIFSVTGSVTVHTVNEDLYRELVESQTEFTEAIAAILDRNPDGPWTLEELEVLAPSVNNSGA